MTCSILWFRQDLRVHDNPALVAACRDHEKGGKTQVIPVYIYDTSQENPWPSGGASKWWLHHSLQALIDSGVPLILRKGNPFEELQKLIRETQAQFLHWNRCYEPYALKRDAHIKTTLNIEVHEHNGSLLFEPWTIQNNLGKPYKVFTPFWKACLQAPDPRPVVPLPTVDYFPFSGQSLDLADLALRPHSPNWADRFPNYWCPGEKGAWEKLETFLAQGIHDYKSGRDFPAKQITSQLSPHLHHGEISPHQIWEAIKTRCEWRDENVRTFIAEIGWREFSYSLLYHFPDLPEVPYQDKFKNLPWKSDLLKLKCWQRGQTGYPIIDAGMRELWTSGYMHNRVRMIVASFLTKHCLIPWQEGERWFWDCLVDADLASNAASWQWVAGSGADASPYFRIFNPVTQGQKFDSQGVYVRQWVPELKDLPLKYLHTPWKAPLDLQQEAQCEIGIHYPTPIVSLETGRQQALQAYEVMKHQI